ncbi:MAG: 2-C-methyl-D-erythritol 4-phosphate cytidylyltransferase [Ignavibacteriales bacterium]|nr:2-C-methyl-D-erythritol 4-phosphate cytidylyltransferase [Ignavibacteriales bacterium]
MTSRPKIYAIIPAAGSGTRLGGPTAKQFVQLGETPLLVHTLRRFEETSQVDEVGLAVPENTIAEVEQLIGRYHLNKVSKVVAGGAHRQDSVYNVLRLLQLRPSDIILVHDGVRPFVPAGLIARVIAECGVHDAAVPAVQPKDTIRRSNGGGFFDQTLDRTALWLVQTPQAFKAGVLIKAFEKALKDKFSATDEAALVERIGIKAKIVEGSHDNIKITTREDLDLGERILARWKVTADT